MLDQGREEPIPAEAELGLSDDLITELRVFMAEILERLDRLESTGLSWVDMSAKENFSTAEVARLLGRSDLTVREWCREGRVHATKRPSGRSASGEWSISRAEVNRINSDGLLKPRCQDR